MISNVLSSIHYMNDFRNFCFKIIAKIYWQNSIPIIKAAKTIVYALAGKTENA